MLGAPRQRRKNLEYDEYADGVTRNVVDALANLRTTSSRIAEHEIEASSVAVIGESHDIGDPDKETG